MNILLINTNMVVSKLVALAAQELNASLDEFSTLAQITKDHYDVVIVDDSVLSSTLTQSIQQILTRCTIVLFSNIKNEMQDYDIKLKKPFLPHDLTAAVIRDIEEGTPISHQSQERKMSSSSEHLIEQILHLEASKIKEILQGAKVSITIEFPKEER